MLHVKPSRMKLEYIENRWEFCRNLPYLAGQIAVRCRTETLSVWLSSALRCGWSLCIMHSWLDIVLFAPQPDGRVKLLHDSRFQCPLVMHLLMVVLSVYRDTQPIHQTSTRMLPLYFRCCCRCYSTLCASFRQSVNPSPPHRPSPIRRPVQRVRAPGRVRCC